jgi:hypothetical protein
VDPDSLCNLLLLCRVNKPVMEQGLSVPEPLVFHGVKIFVSSPAANLRGGQAIVAEAVCDLLWQNREHRTVFVPSSTLALGTVTFL